MDIKEAAEFISNFHSCKEVLPEEMKKDCEKIIEGLTTKEGKDALYGGLNCLNGFYKSEVTKYMDIKRKLLEDIIEYMEFAAEKLDSEWGLSRDIEELIKDGQMPEEYYEIIKLLKQ